MSCVVLLLGLVAWMPCQDERLGAPQSPPAGVVAVAFDIKQPVTPPHERVFLLGDLSQLGSGDVTRALPLQSEDGLHWRITVALPAGEAVAHSFWVRDQRLTRIIDPENATLVEERVLRTHRTGPRLPGKALFLHSDFERPILHWRHQLGFGQGHSVVLAGRRMERMLTFLAPATKERNPELWPPTRQAR